MLRLPQELADMVVDTLADDLHSLLACNSTSRRLRARARAHLYRAVLIGDVEHDSLPPAHLRVSFADAANPGIAWSVITYLQLSLFEENEELWDTLVGTLSRPECRLRSLQDLVLKGDGDDIPAQWLVPLVDVLHQCCRSVRYLDLEHCCFWQLSLLAYLVTGFRELQHLVVPVQITADLDAASRFGELPQARALRSISVPVTGARELQLAADISGLLRDNAKCLLLVDSFFLWDLLSGAPETGEEVYSNVKAITLDTKWEDCDVEQVLDVFPALEFLCVSVRIQESFFATSRSWKSTQINLAIRTLQTPAVHFGPLRYLAMALSVPAHLALRTLAGARLDDLCDALCAPHARHIRLVLICLLEVGSTTPETAATEPLLCGVKADVERYFEKRFGRLSAKRRWTSIVAREGNTQDGGWRDLRGSPMQKLMSECVSGGPHNMTLPILTGAQARGPPSSPRRE